MTKKRPIAIYGKRLREARENYGASQDDLGVAVGLDPAGASGRVSRYENGIHQPKLVLQHLFAEGLGLPLAYFYAEDDELARLISEFGRKDKPGQRRIKIKIKKKAKKPKPNPKRK